MIVTPDAIEAFAAVTGDDAPIHTDAAFAIESGYAGPVAQGLLVASWAHAELSRQLGAGVDRASSCFNVRFRSVVTAGDRLTLRLGDASATAGSFEVVNERGDVVSTGEWSESSSAGAASPEPFSAPAGTPAAGVYYAEDMLALGPRGDAVLQPVSQSDVERFADAVGGPAQAGVDVTPAPFVFALGFAAFLRELLRYPMPAAGFAGHLGDSWRVHRLVKTQERLRLVYGPSSCVTSRSRPGMALVRFGLQFIDAVGAVVQDGEAVMMIPARPADLSA